MEHKEKLITEQSERDRLAALEPGPSMLPADPELAHMYRVAWADCLRAVLVEGREVRKQALLDAIPIIEHSPTAKIAVRDIRALIEEAE